jgi:hypothetical protein
MRATVLALAVATMVVQTANQPGLTAAITGEIDRDEGRVRQTVDRDRRAGAANRRRRRCPRSSTRWHQRLKGKPLPRIARAGRSPTIPT